MVLWLSPSFVTNRSGTLDNCLIFYVVIVAPHAAAARTTWWGLRGTMSRAWLKGGTKLIFRKAQCNLFVLDLTYVEYTSIQVLMRKQETPKKQQIVVEHRYLWEVKMISSTLEIFSKLINKHIFSFKQVLWETGQVFIVSFGRFGMQDNFQKYQYVSSPS